MSVMDWRVPAPAGAVPLPARAPGLRIAHVSDIHVGATDDLTLEGLAADLAAADPAATIVTGDLTMRARPHEFAHAVEIINEFPAPHLVVLGNHDIPLLDPVARMTAPYKLYRSAVTPELDPVLDLPGGARIQGLQSMPRWRWKSGRVSDRQAEIVRQRLGQAPQGWARVVALHHPISSQDLETIANASDFEAALIAAQADIVLAGHTHVPSVRAVLIGEPGNSRQVIEVVAGTATSHRTRGVPRSWSLLEVTATELVVTERVCPAGKWEEGLRTTLPMPAGTHLVGVTAAD